MNLDDDLGPTLLILHGLLSAGADPSEKTIDTAIAGAALLAAKVNAKDELADSPKRSRSKKPAADASTATDPPPPAA